MREVFEGWHSKFGDPGLWFQPESIDEPIFHCPTLLQNEPKDTRNYVKLRITIEEIDGTDNPPIS